MDNLPEGRMQPMFTLDRKRYATNAFYPDRPVAIGHTGYIRDQAVAQIQFTPVQYNPVASEVHLYRYIRVEITWATPLTASAANARSISPLYERVLQHAILNYDALERHPDVGTPLPLSSSEVNRVTADNSLPALKIGVTGDGFYELTYSDLADAGFDLNRIDSRTLTMRNRGVEIPIEVYGQDDGTFDSGDSLLFYATAITSIYTAENIYWLATDSTDGRRMTMQDGTVTGNAPAPVHFPVTIHAEEDSHYWVTMPNGDGQDHWFWAERLSAPEARDYPLTLRHLSTSAGWATVRVRLKGFTDIPALNPDHHTKIYLNGVEIDDQLWDGQHIFDHDVTVPHHLLNEGNNAITVETVGDTGAVVDQLYVNWIEIDYWDTYVAENDALHFGVPEAGTFQFDVSGFSSNAVEVFDITDPANVVRIINTRIVNDGNGYSVRFEQTAQIASRYLAQTPRQRKPPASLAIDEPSSWRLPSNRADYIIITHSDFYSSAMQLAEYHRASGLRVVTVQVEDIYDEFTDGIFHPQAIRDFLAYAYHNWIGPAPTYVLLVGDAYQDYKNNRKQDMINYVPSQAVEVNSFGQYPSDNWFVTVSGDDILPDMLIGRLPARSVEEAEVMADKILHYERHPPDDAWYQQVLLVADDKTAAFEEISEQLADLLPLDYTAHKVYVSNYPPGNPTQDISGYINTGSMLVTYTGHGARSRWGRWGDGESIFEWSDIRALQNTLKLPVVTVANCMNGYFVADRQRSRASVAEEFLRLPEAGAVAVWAPTSLGYPSGHRQ